MRSFQVKIISKINFFVRWGINRLLDLEKYDRGREKGTGTWENMQSSNYLLPLSLIRVGKSKDRPKVGRLDRTETVGPRKWTGPVSVQIRSGLGQAFGLGPKAKIRKSKNPTIRFQNPKSENPSFRKSKLSRNRGFLSSGFRHLHHHRKSRHLPASAISIIIVKPLQTTVSIFYLLGFPILLALYL